MQQQGKNKQDLVKYAFIIVVIAIAVIVLLIILNSNTGNVFSNIISNV